MKSKKKYEERQSHENRDSSIHTLSPLLCCGPLLSPHLGELSPPFSPKHPRIGWRNPKLSADLVKRQRLLPKQQDLAVALPGHDYFLAVVVLGLVSLAR